MQNNWQKSIKDKMAHREIKPSQNAWNQLEKELPKPVYIKKRRVFLIAAGILLLVGLSVYFFILQESSGSLKIVNSKKEMIIPNKNRIFQEGKSIKNKVEKDTFINKTKTIAVQQKKSVKKINEIQQTTVQDSSQSIAFQQKDTLNKVKINSVKTAYITANDLLAQVEKEIKNPQSKTIVVDKQRLLSEVEDVIFEDKTPVLLDKITNGIKKIQVALREKIIK